MIDKYYRNTENGKMTADHRTAMEWYRAGADIEIKVLNKASGTYKTKTRWVHKL
jgi:elongation factor P--beta-lysine ligase